jgi:2-polyprenyl-3-methyl-5-hydroxy-6-metoxy-1,4-benzoquinol methylase
LTEESLEHRKWNEVKAEIGNESITLGPYFSYQFRHSPRHVLFSLSRYKFAAKLLGNGKELLEVGCSEGLGTLILGENAKTVVAIDIDNTAIENAAQNFASEKMRFIQADFLNANLGVFDGVVSFDVIEHIYPENEQKFFNSITLHLKPFGVCIIGTPNLTADCYASKVAKKGHVNMYDWERLYQTIERYFHQVFIFSANDEMIHTGFYPMAHYLIGVGIGKKM